MKEKLLWVFLPLSLVMCILWLNAPADQVVENLTFVAEHFQWNMVLLACTVLAMGNSLSDYYTDAGMAAIGYGVMAVTGAVSAQFFNFTVGWGLGLFRQILTKGDVEFDLFGLKGKQSSTALYACVLLGLTFIHLWGILFVPRLTGNVLTKNFAKVLYAIYGLFCVSMGLMCLSMWLIK